MRIAPCMSFGSAYDRTPVLTVSAAIAYGERLRRMDRAPALADPAASAR